MNWDSIIENIEIQESKLNDWERLFISSVSNQEYPLTETQQERILIINRKIHKL